MLTSCKFFIHYASLNKLYFEKWPQKVCNYPFYDKACRCKFINTMLIVIVIVIVLLALFYQTAFDRAITGNQSDIGC